ncbi:MAG TPA: hypothetical protein VGD43_23090, partial [Micromonospora sp.]
MSLASMSSARTAPASGAVPFRLPAGTAYGAVAGLALAVLGTATSVRVLGWSWAHLVPHGFGVLAIGAGLLVAARSTMPRVGRLMVACGGVYHLSDLRTSEQPVLFAVGFCLAYLWTAVLGHIALAMPAGRVTGTGPRALLVVCYLAPVGTQVGRFLAEHPEPPWWWTVMPAPNTPWAKASSLAYALVSVAVLLVVARRWLTATRLRRRPVGPVWAAVVVTGVVGVATAVVSLAGAPVRVRAAVLLCGLVMEVRVLPVVGLVRRVRLELARGRAACAVLEAERRHRVPPHPEHLERALAEAVGDPTLRLAYPLADGSFVDIGGHRVPDDPHRPGRAVTPVRRHGTLLARVEHDEALVEQHRVT